MSKPKRKDIGINKWRKIYFILALLDLLAVGLSLVLNHHLANQFEKTIQSNEFLSDRLERIEDLQVLASDVNAPGNDIFDSENVEQEKKRLIIAIKKFNNLHDETLDDFNHHREQYSLEKVIDGYSNIQFQMNEMLNETELIFKYFETNKKTLAANRMATMDRKYAQLRGALIVCSKEIRKIQKIFLELKRSESENLRYYEFAFSFFMIVMVIGILSYGKVMSNFVNQALKDKNLLEEQTNDLHASAIVAETDIDGSITYANDKLVEMSKYTHDELIGANHRLLNSGHHPKEFFQDLWSTITNGQVWNNEVKNKTKYGSYYWVDTTIYPIKKANGEIVKFIAIRFDITEKKNNLLSLEKATIQAKKAVEAKSAFLANMSHEIRTQLNGVLGFTTLLLDQKLPEEALENINHIKDCSESLLMIINDILDISKIDAGKLSVEKNPLDLRKTVESSLFVFNALILKKGIGLNCKIGNDVPPAILGDPLRIRQILLNLIGNAVKFTDQGLLISRLL